MNKTQISLPIFTSLLLLLIGLFLSYYVVNIIIAHLIRALTIITGLNLFRNLTTKSNKENKNRENKTIH